MARDPFCAPRNFGGWHCDDCGALNDSCDATCGCERRPSQTVQVTMTDGRQVEVDFSGSPMQAAIMVVRHYAREATEAWTCHDGKRVARVWKVGA